MKDIHKKSLISVATFSLIAAGIMTFAAAFSTVGKIYWGIIFALWGLGLLIVFFLFFLVEEKLLIKIFRFNKWIYS